MEFYFELEDDEEFDIVFEPDFDFISETTGNRSDKAKVQWKLSECPNQGTKANLFGHLSI